MDNKLIIKQVTNGYVLSWEEDWSSDEKQDIRENKEVIENKGDDNETMKDLLFRIAEHFGQHYNKWGKDNLRISFDGKGSKVN